MKSVKLVRAEILAGYLSLAASLKIDARRLLRDVRLDKIDFSNRRLDIPVSAVIELLERSAEQARIEDFGLRLSSQHGLAQIGPLALLLLEQPTMGHALRAAEVYLRHRNDAMAFRLQERGDIVVLHVGYKPTAHGKTRQVIEYMLCAVYRTFDAITAGAWAPESMSFTHPAPRSPTIHSAVFKTRLLFNENYNGFVLRTCDLDIALRTASPEMAADAKRHIEEIGPQHFIPFDAKVREIVVHLLPGGRCASDVVAGHLGIDRTTINRRLAAQGETFSSILNDVRAELAQRYIATDRKPLTQTAELLGFAGLPSFSRWFRDTFGTSPTAWREHHDRTSAKKARKMG